MGTLNASMCVCGQIFIPPKQRCIICTGKTEPREINDTGNIMTYTVLQVAHDGFDAPLILGIVELDVSADKNDEIGKIAANPKIICQGQVPEKDLRIGMKVKVKKIDDIYIFMKMGI